MATEEVELELDTEKLVSFLAFVGAAIILVGLYYIVTHRFGEFTYVRSSVDNKMYKVRKVGNAKAAADTLARLSQKLTKLVEHAKSTNGPHEKHEADINRLVDRFDTDAIGEASEYISDGSLTSYTVNKGEKIGFCLKCRECDNETFEKDNTLVFVGVHELAHIANDEEGHGTKFQELNKFLLGKATECGVWSFQDYRSQPVRYCGTLINGMP